MRHNWRAPQSIARIEETEAHTRRVSSVESRTGNHPKKIDLDQASRKVMRNLLVPFSENATVIERR